MGNRAWLSLQADRDGRTVSSEALAGANGSLPTLWQVLLAEGTLRAADASQRVFGDAGTAALAAPAQAGLDRLRLVADFVRGHAASGDAPHCVQLDAAVAYLVERIDARLAKEVRAAGAAPGDVAGLWISANLDELAWLHADGADAYLAHARTLCADHWQALQDGMRADDIAAVLRLLGVTGADDESGWAWRVGLGGLAHPYFDLQEPARRVRYEDFDEDGDEDEDEGADDDGDDEACASDEHDPDDNGNDNDNDNDNDNNNNDKEAVNGSPAKRHDTHLGDGLHRFAVDNLWGVREGRGENGRVVVPPQFDSIWRFEDGVAAVLKDDKLGLIDTSGRVLMPCQLDEVWSYSQGLAMARIGEQIGFVDRSGAWAIPAAFGSAGDFSPGGLAPAFQAECWGLIDRRGAWASPPVWDDINWDDALHAYVTQRGDLCGLIDAQGRLVLDAQYAALAPVDTESDPAGLWISGKMRIRVLTDDDRRGVVDGQGDVVVPLVYTDLADIIWLPAPDPADITPPPAGQVGRYVRVLRCVDHGEWNEWFQGVYDTAERRETLSCTQQMLFGLMWNGTYGWLCAVALEHACEQASEHSPDGLHIGIADANGAWLHEPVYAWIGVPAALHTGDGVHGVPSAIAQCWSQGQAVPAMHADGTMRYLHADGRVQAAPR